MRWFAVFLLLVLVGAGGGYYYWKNYSNEIESGLQYCPDNTMIVFEASNADSLLAILTDSNAIFSAHTQLNSFAFELSTLLAPLKATNTPIIVAASSLTSNPELTLIINSTFKEVQSLEGIVATSSGNWLIYSNHQITVSPSKNELIDEIEKARSTASGSVKMMVDAAALFQIIIKSTDPEIIGLFKEQVHSVNWLGMSLGKNQPLTLSAATKTSKAYTGKNQSQELLKVIPNKTNAALCISDSAQSIALLHIPYQLTPSSAQDNYFLLIQPDSISTKFKPFEIQKVSTQDLPSYSPKWNMDQAVKVNLGKLLLYAANTEQAQRYITDFNAYNFLSGGSVYQKMNPSITDAALTLFVQRLGVPEEPHALNTNSDSGSFNAFIIQINRELTSSEFYSMSALYGKPPTELVPELWSTEFETEISGGPWSFTNHYTNDVEIIVQDKLNQLYLLNAEGKILWKKQLDGKIIGDISSIDAFASGKNQMLLATQKRLQLIDRNGNNVEGFPITLSNGNTSQPKAIRYVKDGDLRILVGDGTIVKNYDAEGKPVNGWTNPALDAGIVLPIEYVKYGNKDFILTYSAANKLSIFDRTGKPRSEKIEFPLSATAVSLTKGSSLKECHIVGFDSAGNIVTKFFNGDLKTKNTLPVGKKLLFEHSPQLSTEYAVFADGQLFGLDGDFNVTIDLLLPNKSMSGMRWLDQNKGVLTIWNSDQTMVRFITDQSVLVSGMPSKGDGKSLLLDLDKNGIKELLLHDGAGKLSAYRVAL